MVEADACRGGRAAVLDGHDAAGFFYFFSRAGAGWPAGRGMHPPPKGDPGLCEWRRHVNICHPPNTQFFSTLPLHRVFASISHRGGNQKFMKNQKRILEEYRSSALRAEMLKQELKELERSTWHTSTSGMLKGYGSGKERFCEARSSLQQKLENEIFELTKKREKVLSLTNSLDDDLLKLVLELKYVRGLTYEKIADVIRYSLRQTMRLHNKAISMLEEKAK